MYAAFCSLIDIEDALTKVNEKYKDNIIFVPSSKLELCVFTLLCKDYDGPGAWLEDTNAYTYSQSKNPNGRVVKPCYHVHRDFYDILFDLNPKFKVFDKGTRISINDPLKERNEWCHCNKETYEKELKENAEK